MPWGERHLLARYMQSSQNIAVSGASEKGLMDASSQVRAGAAFNYDVIL